MPTSIRKISIILIALSAIITIATLLKAAGSQSTAQNSLNPKESTSGSPAPGSANPRSNQTSAAPTAATPAAVPAPGGLTPDSLKTTLNNMGLDVKDAGNGVCLVSQTRDNWTINVNVSVSPDATVLWFFAQFNPIPDIDKVPSSVWRNLLLCNSNYGITFCLMQPAQGQPYLQLQHGIENRTITPQIIKRNLDLMFDSVVNNANWWDSSKWPKPGSATTTP